MQTQETPAKVETATEANIPRNWNPNVTKTTKTLKDATPYIDAPRNHREMVELNEMNTRIVEQLQALDNLVGEKAKYLPPKDPSVIDSFKKKKRLKQQHIMLVLAMNNNPHLAAKSKKKRDKIVADVMKGIVK